MHSSRLPKFIDPTNFSSHCLHLLGQQIYLPIFPFPPPASLSPLRRALSFRRRRPEQEPRWPLPPQPPWSTSPARPDPVATVSLRRCGLAPALRPCPRRAAWFDAARRGSPCLQRCGPPPGARPPPRRAVCSSEKNIEKDDRWNPRVILY
jgi:hypothetical protein